MNNQGVVPDPQDKCGLVEADEKLMSYRHLILGGILALYEGGGAV